MTFDVGASLALLLVLTLLDPILWVSIALAHVDKKDKAKRDLRIWWATEL